MCDTMSWWCFGKDVMLKRLSPCSSIIASLLAVVDIKFTTDILIQVRNYKKMLWYWLLIKEYLEIFNCIIILQIIFLKLHLNWLMTQPISYSTLIFGYSAYLQSMDANILATSLIACCIIYLFVHVHACICSLIIKIQSLQLVLPITSLWNLASCLVLKCIEWW